MKIDVMARLTRNIGRWAIAFVLGVALLVSNVSPAAAFGSKTSAPSDGIDALSKVEQQSKEVKDSQPRGMEDVKSRAKGGLNGVQGSADKSKMNTPANSKGANTVADDIKDSLGGLAD